MYDDSIYHTVAQIQRQPQHELVSAPSVKANAGTEVQACEYVHSKWGGDLTANLINLCEHVVC